MVPGRGTGSHEATVRVPATSANLGPGYDCLGLCLDLWDEVSVSTLDGRGVEIDVTGEGEHTIARDESHLVIATIRRALADLGHPDPRCGLMLRAHNRIAQSRELRPSSLDWPWDGGLLAPGSPLTGTGRLASPPRSRATRTMRPRRSSGERNSPGSTVTVTQHLPQT